MKERIKSKIKRNLKWLVILIIIFFIWAGIKVWSIYQEANPNWIYEEISLKERNLKKIIKVDGEVLSDYEINLASEVPGIISKVYVKEGEYVKKGQLLAKLKDSDYRSQLNSAYVNINLNKASYEKTKKPNQNLETDLEILENNKKIVLENIQKVEADIQFNLGNLEIFLDQTSRLEIDDYFAHLDTYPVFTYRLRYETQMDNLEEERYRLGISFNNYLKKEDKNIDDAILIISQFEKMSSDIYSASVDFLGFDDKREEEEQKKASALKEKISGKKNVLVGLKTNLDKLGKELRSFDFSKEKIKNAVSEEDLKIAQEKIRQAQVGASNAYLQLQKTYLRAPKNGIIISIFKNSGEYVNPSEPIIKLNSKDSYFQILVPEVDIAKIKKDYPVKIKLDAFGSKIFNGKIDVIYPENKEVFGIVYYRVKVLFEKTDLKKENILPGMSGESEIIYQQRDNLWSIERGVAKKDREKYFVWILNSDKKELFDEKFIKKYFEVDFVANEFLEVKNKKEFENLKILKIKDEGKK